MTRNTGFTEKVRELLRNEGFKSSKEILSRYGNLIKGTPSNALHKVKDIKYVGDTQTGFYYLNGREDAAKKRYEELKLRIKENKSGLEKLNSFIPLNTDVKSSLDLFETDEDEYTLEEMWRMRGGCYGDFASGVKSLEKANLLISSGKNPKKYRRNPRFAKICDGDYKKASKEMFG